MLPENDGQTGGAPQGAPSSSPAEGAPAGAPQGGAPPNSDILNFDPFGPTADQGQPSEPTSPEAGAEPQAPAPQQLSAPPAAPQGGEDIAALRAQIARLEAAIAQPQAQQPAAPQSQEQRQPRYNARVPEQIMQMMSSEDPMQRMQGVTMLVNGIGEMVHDTVMREVTSTLQNFQQEVPRMAQATVQDHAAQVATFQDFYGKFPELNNPVFYPMVLEVASKIAKEKGAKAWSGELRDAIGQEVYKLLKWQVPQAPKPKAPAVTPGGSARPAAVNSGTDPQQAAMLDLLQ